MAQRSFAAAVEAARTFLAEAEVVRYARPRPLSDRLRSPQQVYEFVLQRYPDLPTREQESFFALALDSKHRVKACFEVSRGTLAQVDVHPREVFRPLISAAAAAWFAVHNHPSGDPEPSGDDLALTSRLKECGQLLGILLLDHCIIGGDNYVSLTDRGVL
jgi:DNA repair protein RadC